MSQEKVIQKRVVWSHNHDLGLQQMLQHFLGGSRHDRIPGEEVDGIIDAEFKGSSGREPETICVNEEIGIFRKNLLKGSMAPLFGNPFQN